MRIINRCPHTRIIGIYGDEANHGFRLRCADCGRLLDGPAKLATITHADHWKSYSESRATNDRQ